MGTTIKTKNFLKIYDLKSFLLKIKFNIPSRAYEAGVSPGWTLAVTKITGFLFLNLNALGVSLSGNKTGLI